MSKFKAFFAKHMNRMKSFGVKFDPTFNYGALDLSDD